MPDSNLENQLKVNLNGGIEWPTYPNQTGKLVIYPTKEMVGRKKSLCISLSRKGDNTKFPLS
jgi:hypothetical protein